MNAPSASAAGTGLRPASSRGCRRGWRPLIWIVSALVWLPGTAPTGFGQRTEEPGQNHPGPALRDPVYPGSGAYGGATARDQVRTDYWSQWATLHATTERLLKTIGEARPDAALLLRQTQTNAQFLSTRWSAWFDSHSFQQAYAAGDPYLKSLRADNGVLASIKKNTDPEMALDKIRDVATDVQIKADNCRYSKDSLGRDIGVTVHTKSAGQEVGGYEVYFVSKGMYDVKSEHDRFLRESSPTDERVLSPGGYMMWTRKQGVTSPPVAMGIGGHGETHLVLDLEVSAK